MPQNGPAVNTTQSPPPTAPKTEPRPASLPQPKAIRLPEASIRAPEPDDRKLYELCVLPGCPRQNVVAKGFTFQTYRGHPALDDAGNMVGRIERGLRQRLSAADVKAVQEWVGRRVVITRDNGRKEIHDVGSTEARQNARSAEPLARYLSMTEIPEDLVAAEDAQPVSMAG